MIKLNFWRRLVVNLIYALGIFVMIILPAIFGIREIYGSIEFVEGNTLALNWAVSGVLILIVFAILYIKWFRKWFHRKLIGLQVRDELGIMPVKGLVGIIADRLLRTLELVYPFTITLLTLYVCKYAFGYQYEVFNKLYEFNIILLYLAAAGFGVMLTGDFIKIHFMQRQEVDNKLNLKAKANKQQLKELRKADKNALRALAIERQLAELREGTVIPPELEEPEELIPPEAPESP